MRINLQSLFRRRPLPTAATHRQRNGNAWLMAPQLGLRDPLDMPTRRPSRSTDMGARTALGNLLASTSLDQCSWTTKVHKCPLRHVAVAGRQRSSRQDVIRLHHPFPPDGRSTASTGARWPATSNRMDGAPALACPT